MSKQERVNRMVAQAVIYEAKAIKLHARVRSLRQQLRAVNAQLRYANRGMERQAVRAGNTHALWMRERERADGLERENAQLKARIAELEAQK